MKIESSESERREVHAVFMELFKSAQYATDQLLKANEGLREGYTDEVGLQLLNTAQCHQKIAELSKRLVQGFGLEGTTNEDLYLAPLEIPKPGQPCSLANLMPEKH